MRIVAIATVVVAIPLAAALAACASSTGGSKTTTAATTAAPAATTTTTPAKATPTHTSASASVSHELGSKDATADVKLGKVVVDPTMLSLPTVPVIVTNHSSKRSNYLIQISLETADGKTQIDSTNVVVDNLEPGQVSHQTGQFFRAVGKTLPAGAKAVLTSVDRLAA